MRIDLDSRRYKKSWGIPLEAFISVWVAALLMMIAALTSGLVSGAFLGAAIALLVASFFLVITQTGTLE